MYMERFHNYFEPTWRVVTSPLFLSFTHLYISLIYDVLLNKAWHVFDEFEFFIYLE